MANPGCIVGARSVEISRNSMIRFEFRSRKLAATEKWFGIGSVSDAARGGDDEKLVADLRLSMLGLLIRRSNP